MAQADLAHVKLQTPHVALDAFDLLQRERERHAQREREHEVSNLKTYLSPCQSHRPALFPLPSPAQPFLLYTKYLPNTPSAEAYLPSTLPPLPPLCSTHLV